MTIDAVHASEDVEQNLRGWLHCVNHGDAFLWIIRQHWPRLFFVNVEAILNNLLIGIVEPVVLQSALFQANE